jgi:hypothetical protein
VSVPGFNRDCVKSDQVYLKPYKQLQGLARLLWFEYHFVHNVDAHRLYGCTCHSQTACMFHSKIKGCHSRSIRTSIVNTEDNIQYHLDDIKTQVSDYQSIFLPYGPKWTISKLHNLLVEPQIFSGKKNMLCTFNFCLLRHDTTMKLDDLKTLVEFRTQDPGTQFTGSFQPLYDDWYAMAVHLQQHTSSILQQQTEDSV